MNRKRKTSPLASQTEKQKRYRHIAYDKFPDDSPPTCNCGRNGDTQMQTYRSTMDYFEQINIALEFTHETLLDHAGRVLQQTGMREINYPCHLDVLIRCYTSEETLFTAFAKQMLTVAKENEDDQETQKNHIDKCAEAMFTPNTNRCLDLMEKLIPPKFFGWLLSQWRDPLASYLMDISCQYGQYQNNPQKLAYPATLKNEEIQCLNMLRVCVRHGISLDEILHPLSWIRNKKIVFRGDVISGLVAYWVVNPGASFERTAFFKSYCQNADVDISQTCQFDLNYFSEDKETDYPPGMVSPFMVGDLHKTNFYYFCQWLLCNDQPPSMVVLEQLKFRWLTQRKICTHEFSKYFEIDDLVWLCLAFLFTNPAFGPPEYVIINPAHETI